MGRKSCCVPNCGYSYDGKYSMHCFPSGKKNQERREAWIQAVNCPDIATRINFSRVCAQHFSADQWIPFHIDDVRLKREAVPNIFPDPPQVIKLEETIKIEVVEPKKRRRRRKRNADLEAPEVDGLDGIFVENAENDINYICGICYSQFEYLPEASMTTLISSNEGLEIYKILESISTYSFWYDGPQNICSPCFEKIKTAYSLQQLCNEAQHKFAERLSENLVQYEHKYSKLDESVRESYVETKSPKNLYQCQYCSKLYSKAKILGHERTHTGETPYKCASCGESFSTGSALKHHAVIHEEKIYSCGYCLKTFTNIGLLRKHLRTHIETILCQICGRLFHYAGSFRTHLKWHALNKEATVIPGKRVYKIRICNLCGKSYKRKCNCSAVPKSLHDKREKYRCKKCGKRFVNYRTKMMHEKDETWRPFKCEICDKGFFNRGKLNDHRVVHTDEKPFLCVLCQRTFKFRNSLKIHLRSHYEVLPFACDKCGKGFYESRTLRTHLQKKHNEDDTAVLYIVNEEII